MFKHKNWVDYILKLNTKTAYNLMGQAHFKPSHLASNVD